jgi:translation initiation factor IF-3
MKEIQLSAEIGDNDLRTKAKKAIELLSEGSKIRCVLLLKGRQKAHPERGEVTVLKFLDIISEYGVAEAMPKMEGSRWLVMIKPKRKG